ncbi:cryptochrome/photolyase family protein [Corynebacterium alimapuense]|uniref:Deoxyribodipyrimidine photo-lyase n=1 Tax=Corynebacterium alimapuense TaxID=1576874 RepID=A0A3M8KB07_9CORY|nr:deoxyribodipyrimidine photo-lyase [Corynebacterium alimapuense]RNE49648.1 deoxyribodipyrimidine photo-lyase [Corynebacterium alimapuense]
MVSPILVWFRDDLRLHDHAALSWAAERGPVVGFVIDEDPKITGTRGLGAASRWWRERSLKALADQLASADVPLLRLSGDPLVEIPRLIAETGASAVTWHRRYHAPLCEHDAAIKTRLTAEGVLAKSHPGYLLTEPHQVKTGQNTPYRVFTPFSRKATQLFDASPSLPVPPNLSGPGAQPWPEPAAVFWASGLAKTWQPGEAGARLRAADFSTRGAGYAEGRDLPAVNATSGLSPHLRFGEISPRELWELAAELPEADGLRFRAELLWRDFAWHRLFHLPDLATHNVRSSFDAFPWKWQEGELERASAGMRDPRRSADGTESWLSDLGDWRSGTTGIELVDAGMRELWQTGTMHNRVRMVVASLLTKNLGIHWRHGEEWFWETLVDADAASNPFNWQWVAGCGDDAAPYFRIFNPATQQKRFDPEGQYCNHWVPERLTPNYPLPMVDLKDSRAMALAAYEQVK